ncbi:Oxidoreductase [Labilithrix luteola]|uniref:Oxidoreductase n=1 Tax=Labilithrix luteola TaxID=1391654 RepID=A0A0K1QFG3_9BACT|nr:NAD(P)/FAD-dependent oxidoreductase [Labilithrix luteola]AKV04170.1 Oxidoreductase [Labilithrix luteola]
MRPLDVGIIGSGTAGSAAALFLARAGHRVTVYERVPDPKPVGAGIAVQPTGLHVLCRLRLYSDVVARGSKIDRLFVERANVRSPGARKTLFELSYESAGEGLFGLGLHRGVLFQSLFGALRREPVTIRCGVEIVDLARAERSMERRRSTYLVDKLGERHGPHELVVVADGARSQLRDDTNTSKRIAKYPWGALWFVGRDARGDEPRHARILHQIVSGNRRLLGMLPTGIGPKVRNIAGQSEPAPAGRLVSLFWSVRGDEVEALRRGGLGRWKDEVRALAPEAAPIVETIDDVDRLLFAEYHDVVMHRWSTRNVVYLGDAAHATSPQLGQGANLALWDAMVLADCLSDETHDLSRALGCYSRAREPHLGFYQFATRWLTPFFQGDEAALGELRDLAMPLMAKVPLMRRLMTLSMLGVVDGFGGRTLALRLPREPSERETRTSSTFPAPAEPTDSGALGVPSQLAREHGAESRAESRNRDAPHA